jgi:uncharacterized coiled-coil protein SlyX
MFGTSKEIEDLKNRLATQEKETERLRDLVAGLLDRVQELELKGQRPKSHFTK